MRRLALILFGSLLAMMGFFGAAVEARAESPLVTSDPEPRAELSAAPGWVTVVFDRDAGTKLVKVIVLNSAGANMVVGDLMPLGSSVMAQLKDNLRKGTYTVMYQLDRGDGQPEGGAYQFSYGKGDWTQVVTSWSGEAEQPPQLRNPDPDVPEPTATPSVTEPQVETGSAQPVPSDSSGSPAPGANVGTDAPAWLWWTGAGALAAIAGGSAWWLSRRRRGTKPSRAQQ